MPPFAEVCNQEVSMCSAKASKSPGQSLGVNSSGVADREPEKVPDPKGERRQVTPNTPLLHRSHYFEKADAASETNKHQEICIWGLTM